MKSWRGEDITFVVKHWCVPLRSGISQRLYYSAYWSKKSFPPSTLSVMMFPRPRRTERRRQRKGSIKKFRVVLIHFVILHFFLPSARLAEESEREKGVKKSLVTWTDLTRTPPNRELLMRRCCCFIVYNKSHDENGRPRTGKGSVTIIWKFIHVPAKGFSVG